LRQLNKGYHLLSKIYSWPKQLCSLKLQDRHLPSFGSGMSCLEEICGLQMASQLGAFEARFARGEPCQEAFGNFIVVEVGIQVIVRPFSLENLVNAGLAAKFIRGPFPYLVIA
jgi:hypothetical protein